MALGLQNLSHALRVNQRNVDRFQNRIDGVPSAQGAVTGAEEMRIDSDDIHNHYHQQREGMNSLAKVAAIALAATGVGIPASIAALQLPEILAQFFPTTEPPAAVAPAEPKSEAPVVNIGGQEYELRLEPDTE